MRLFSLAALVLCAACARPEPAPQAADADTGACATPADCKGMLPHLCRACGDGGTECARWSCVSGSCAIALCGETQP